MKVEYQLFLYLTVFFFVAAVIYGIFAGADEPAGVVAIALTGGLSLIVGSFLWFSARRLEQTRPEDNVDAEVSDGAGELGFFSPGSYWPICIAGSAAVFAIATAFMLIWLMVVAGFPGDDHLRPALRVPPGPRRPLSSAEHVASATRGEVAPPGSHLVRTRRIRSDPSSPRSLGSSVSHFCTGAPDARVGHGVPTEYHDRSAPAARSSVCCFGISRVVSTPTRAAPPRPARSPSCPAWCRQSQRRLRPLRPAASGRQPSETCRRSSRTRPDADGFTSGSDLAVPQNTRAATLPVGEWRLCGAN